MKCQHNEIPMHKANKEMTHAPGNASGTKSSHLKKTLNPCAKPFTLSLRTTNLADFSTLKFMAFCIILSLSINMNLVMIEYFDSNQGDESIFLDKPSLEVSPEIWNESNVTDLSDIPFIVNISTPNITGHEEWNPRVGPDSMSDLFIPSSVKLNPLADPFIPLLSDLDMSKETVSESTGNVSFTDVNDPKSLLTGLKEKNSERPLIAQLNINSISSKFEPLQMLIKDTIDLLVVTESKLDDTFPPDQFQIEGFSRPIRLDRNRNGGGIIIFVREGLTCKELKPRKLYPDIESTFLEIRI